MSLVNDMLRDLDAREGGAERVALGAPQAAAPAPRRNGMRAICLTSLLLAAASGCYWYFAGVNEKGVVPGSATAAMPDLEAGGTEAAAMLALQPALAVEPPPETHSPATALSEEEDHAPVPAQEEASPRDGAVEQLLAAAQQALDDNRLTQPPVNNAYALYRHVLLLQADNSQAHAGLEQIQERYEQLIIAALANGQATHAQRYLQRAETVGLPKQRLKALNGEIATLEAELAAQQAEEQEQQSAMADASPASTGEAIAGQQSAVIKPSRRARQTAALENARDLMAQGRLAEAAGELEVLAAQPKAEAAALMLFDLYLQMGELDQARAMQQTAATVALGYYYRAKLLAQGGENTAALALLDQAEPSRHIHQPYRALQAALYQRNGQYDKAARIYSELVDLDNTQPNYWLGLGVAAEALGQNAQALRAFVAADRLPPISPAVSRYIQQRIETLTR